jgi:hypothetical protein
MYYYGDSLFVACISNALDYSLNKRLEAFNINEELFGSRAGSGSRSGSLYSNGSSAYGHAQGNGSTSHSGHN